MNWIRQSTRSFMLLAGLTYSLSSCQDHPNVPSASADVLLATTTLGTVMTTQDGKSLYFFAPDVNGNSNCNGNCATTWPPFFKDNLALGTGLSTTDFSTITRADGTKQTTYKGWPLYNFRNDALAGDVKGENVANNWSVAKPDYTVLRASGQLVGNDGKNYTADFKEGTGTTPYIADARGVSLYTLSVDKMNTNTFTRSDFSNNTTWMIVEPSAQKEIPSFLNKADFGIINVFGRSQVTFKGWPLYYFNPDNKQRGSTKGVSAGARPGFWPILTPTLAAAPQ